MDFFFHEFHIFFQVKHLEVHSAGGESADLTVDAVTDSVKRSVLEMEWLLFSVPDFWWDPASNRDLMHARQALYR